MSDLISRQDAIEKINERARETFTLASGYEYYLGALHDVADDLRQMPTIDAVPVVHCKDCKYYRQNKPYLIAGVPIMGNLVCERWADGCRTDPDGFCFMGERKDDGMDS